MEPIRSLAREVGYAIGVHGSLERDLDLIAAPWREDAVTATQLAEHIAAGINGRVLAPEHRPLGRWSCNIQIDGWFKLIDLSVAPAGRDGALSGSGWVYYSPDVGTEYAHQHPVDSGETPDASDIRRSTRFEDWLVGENQRLDGQIRNLVVNPALSTPSPEAGRGEDDRVLPKIASAHICFGMGWQAGYESALKGSDGPCMEAAFEASDITKALALSPPAPEPEDLFAENAKKPEPGYEAEPVAITDEVVRYIARYGGMCRDCADEDGVCPASGLPCEPDDCDRAIHHVLKALSYGQRHGYIKAVSPAPVSREEIALGEPHTLAACPPGLFLAEAHGTLGMKTEYYTDKGAVEAYIVESGEFFWGDAPHTPERQRAQIVRPIRHDTILQRLSNQQGGGGKGSIPELPGVSAVQLPASPAAQHSDEGEG
ncbi:MAG TPA: hypothetical protein VIO94_16125 [Phenylobacterium sp.]